MSFLLEISTAIFALTFVEVENFSPRLELGNETATNYFEGGKATICVLPTIDESVIKMNTMETSLERLLRLFTICALLLNYFCIS